MMMHDPFPIPSCFFPADKLADDTTSPAATKSGESIVMSVYRTKIAGRSRLVTVTWCKNLLVHGLSVSVEGSCGGAGDCKVELRPWYFWRKHGSRRFQVDGQPVDVLWDLKSARFAREPEPLSGYYVAVVAGDEAALVLGDLSKEACRKAGCRPSAADAVLVSKTEHVFGKKRFVTRAKFNENGKHHEISIECGNGGGGSSTDPEMAIKIDGMAAVHVKHLQWKFRGNESISVNKSTVEVYWDVHDWLFGAGLRHASFIFKPVSSPSCSSAAAASWLPSSASLEGSSSGSCLFLYAWKDE